MNEDASLNTSRDVYGLQVLAFAIMREKQYGLTCYKHFM